MIVRTDAIAVVKKNNLHNCNEIKTTLNAK